MLLRPPPSSPESDRAVKPFKFLLELGPHDSCNKYNLFGIFASFNACFYFNGCVVPSFPLAWANLSWKGLSSQVAYRQSGKGEGLYPVGGVGFHRLARLRLLATRIPHEFARS
jgi:hypothetical protein